MGVASSTLIMRQVEEGSKTERLAELSEKFAFFQRWSLTDVKRALDEYGHCAHAFETRPGEPSQETPQRTAADVLGDTTSWADYYKVTYEVEEERHLDEAAKKRRTWHTASFGYVMREDEEAAPKLARHRMFLERIERGDPEGWEHQGHTDDEDDDDLEEEDLGPVTPAPAPAPAASPEHSHHADGSVHSADDASTDGRSYAETDDDFSAVSGQPSPLSQSGSLSFVENGAPAPAGPEHTPELDEARAPARDPRHPPPEWDPSTRSPIFFGYLDTSVQDLADIENEKKRAKEEKEDEVAEAQREKRYQAIDKFREDSSAKKCFRDKKLKDLEDEHDRQRRKRNNNYRGRRKVCSTEAEALQLDAKYEADEEACTSTCELEADTLFKFNISREGSEAQELERMQNEADQIDGAESCTAPGGRRLERQARRDLKTAQTQLDQACTDLEDAQDQLELQLEEGGTPPPLPGGGAQFGEEDKEAAAATVAEFVAAMKTRIHECEGNLRLGLNALDDAEKLLERAVHRRRREDNILTLFAALGAAEGNTAWDPRSTEDPPYVKAATVDVAGGLLMLCSDRLVTRLRIFLRLFDWDGDGFLAEAELLAAIKCASRLLGGLGFLRRPAGDTELESVASRALSEQRITSQANGGIGVMTLSEATDWLSHSVATSTVLSRLFGVQFAFGELSAYQRQKMPTVRLFELGLLRPADVKYSTAFECSKIREELNHEYKLQVHERACARGLDDPMKADYSRFLKTVKKKQRSAVIPLEHGHLCNKTMYESKISERAATKMQNIWRGKKNREKSEHVARVQAFQQARRVATQAARERVEKDFRNKELPTGVKRHTWDAKVRIFQTRKKAAGEAMDRDAAVRLMMEEASDAVAKQVGDRFDEMEQERGLAPQGLNLDGPAAPPPKDVRSLHSSMTAFASILTNQWEPEEVEEEIETPRREEKVVENDTADLDVYGGDPEAYKRAYEARSRNRVEQMVVGCFPANLHEDGSGESDKERSVRREYADPNPAPEAFLRRLRSVNPVFSALKTEELLLELPSKRLLLNYVETSLRLDGSCLTTSSAESHSWGGSFGAPKSLYSRRKKLNYIRTSPAFPGLQLPDVETILQKRPIGPFLPTELKEHFRLLKDDAIVSEALRKILASDFEFGLLTAKVCEQHALHDAWLLRRVVDRAEDGAQRARTVIDRKVRAAMASTKRGTTPQMLVAPTVDDLLNRCELALKKCDETESIAREALEKETKKIRLCKLTRNYWKRRKRDVTRCHAQIKGLQPGVDVEPADREQWTERYFHALISSDRSAPNRLKAHKTKPLQHLDELRLTELISVCEGFLDASVRGAQTILHEWHLPPDEKTIPVVTSKDADCRAEVGGRGRWGGQVHKYEAWGVRFEVATDEHGMFNGSDEYAAKAAGHERNGCRAYLREALELANVRVPLSATVDYHGFRVLCTAILPTVQIKYSDSGEVRRERRELVHGTDDRGEAVHNDARECNNALASMARRLNLAAHAVKGSKDLNPKTIHASADVRGYKLDNELFGLVNLWNALPSENPVGCDHLPVAARGHSIFWRMLRPEYVKRCSEPLSPDGDCAISSNTTDGDVHVQRCIAATQHLITTEISLLAEDLASRGPMGPRTRDTQQAFDQHADPFALDVQTRRMGSGYGDSDQRLGPARLWGLDVTSELHRVGVNLRHMGLLRRRFWRRLTGTARCDFGSHTLRTSCDFRLEVERGSRLLVAGRVFRVAQGEAFTESECPLEEPFEGLSTNAEVVFAGEVRDARNSKEMRVAILCEMICRAAKHLLRFYLRRSARLHGVVVASIQAPFAIDLLNALTGGHPTSDVIWQEELVPRVCQSYGRGAIDTVEAVTVRTTLIPTLPYLIRRVSALCGLPLNAKTLEALDSAPDGFMFVSSDLTQDAQASLGGGDGARPCGVPVVKHGICHLDVARGLLLAHKARHCVGDYCKLVKKHRPPLYLPLDERPGAHLARNRGEVGGALDGYFARGVYCGVPFLEAADAQADEAVRRPVEGPKCCRFNPEECGHIVSSYSARISPQKTSEPFCVEVWCLLAEGGDGSYRIACMTGRGALAVLQSNEWCFTLFCGSAEVLCRGPKARINQWQHVVGTYDGTMMRLYVNAKPVARIETAPEVLAQNEDAAAARKEQIAEIDKDEADARALCKKQTDKQAKTYMQTAEGVRKIKAAAIKLVEQAEFKFKMDMNAADKGHQRLGKQEALLKARASYRTELYMSNVQALASEFKGLRDDVEDRRRKELDAALERSRRPAVVGASMASGRARQGRHFWHGCLAHVAVYDCLLSSDDVAVHVRSGRVGGAERGAAATARSRDASRLFALAADHFNRAAQSEPDDTKVREQHALCLCDHLACVDASDHRSLPPGACGSTPIAGPAHRRACALLDAAIKTLEGLSAAETLGAVIRRLPEGPAHAFRCVDALDALLRGRPDYFSIHDMHHQDKQALPLRDLALVPKRFGLGSAHAHPRLARAAARCYRLVLADLNLAEVYGGVDLSWARALRNDEALCKLVRDAEDDEDARLIKLGNLEGNTCTIADDDVRLVLNARRLASSLDLTACSEVTDLCCMFAARHNTSLQSITLDGCVQITDEAFVHLGRGAKHATLLAAQGCGKLTNNGFLPIAKGCRHLKALNLSYCGGVNNETLTLAGKHLKHLELFHCAFCTDVTDAGAYAFATSEAATKLRSLDVSYCASLSDDGVAAIAERCGALEYLNLSGLHRVTDQAALRVTHSLWRLRTLSLEDLHLITDAVFFFDRTKDGRAAARERMLGELREVRLAECTRLTDRAFAGLSLRAKHLEKLHCRGVAQLTDAGLGYLRVEPEFKQRRGANLQVLDVSRCASLSDRALGELARACPSLAEVDVSFCLRLTDRAIKALCDHCPSVKHLNVGRCRRLTDGSACLVADALWLEALNFSHNPRLSDAAVEVLIVELAGLTRLDVSGCTLLTDAVLKVIQFHGLHLKRLVCVDCAGFSADALSECRAARPALDVWTSEEHVEDADRPQWVARDADPDHDVPRVVPPPPPPLAPSDVEPSAA